MSNRFVIDRRRGLWLGVCRGFADYSGLPVGLVRLALLALTVISFGLPGVIFYILIGWLAGER
jgi:phage shock protein PspC (stress-responsive transcriptional regulator)